ncbi:transcriptional regulator family: Fungal Specific TF [Penicillium cosmopolitanum]|uniref:Transcriptional regulator family: Fungal Specific TF n=1 Tax=Penicillium cosmopolitanum TaxID=1131564 RepID=A0A9W9VM65_9EURO|nr:transcriptional regulator family: Fungal Specific TF [Penicillium cosmopolitanum]KAJ5385696.1 transcriptional regulator family: Fungal Specific TF [Penicillium cosmopolitanum]
MSLQTHDTFGLPDLIKNSRLMMRLFPVIDGELFEKILLSAYRQPSNNFQFGQASIRACIIAFLAFAARLPLVQAHVKTSITTPLDHDNMAIRARIYSLRYCRNRHPWRVQAVTMLLCELSSGNMRATNYFAAVAARLVFMLGANVVDVRMNSSLCGKKRHPLLRNIFWICYTFYSSHCYIATMETREILARTGHLQSEHGDVEHIIDKDVALRIRQPPTIADENFDLTLPPGCIDQARQDVEREDVHFDQPASDPNISMHSVMLRLNYYPCISIIHRASSRCKAWQEGTGMTYEVSSSLALSVEASRSALCYLQAAEHVPDDGTFWYMSIPLISSGVLDLDHYLSRTLIFYPVSALLSIFCSILQNLLDPHSLTKWLHA